MADGPTPSLEGDPALPVPHDVERSVVRPRPVRMVPAGNGQQFLGAPAGRSSPASKSTAPTGSGDRAGTGAVSAVSYRSIHG